MASNKLDNLPYAFRMHSFRGDLAEGSRSTIYGLAFFSGSGLQFADRGHDTQWWATNLYSTNFLSRASDAERVSYAYRVLVAPPPNARVETWEPRIESAYGWLVSGAVALAFMAGFLGKGCDKDCFSRLMLCLLLAVGWVLLRGGMYALYGANFGEGTDRYMRCASPIFAAILVMAGAIAGTFFHKVREGAWARDLKEDLSS